MKISKSLFGAALGALLTTGVVAGLKIQSAHADTNNVRVGYLANIVFPQALLGLEQGEFKKRVPGVNFTGKNYPAGPEVLEALRAGVIDIAYTGPYPPLKAFVKNKDVVLLGATAKGGTELIVAKNSPIKRVSDLRGKTVGVNQSASTVDAQVRSALLAAGLAPGRDVKIIEVEPAQQADALARGEVAAVAAPAPWPSVAKLKGGRALLNWRQIQDGGNYYAGVYFTTKKFAQANPTLIRRFIAANNGITAAVNKNRAAGNARTLAAWSKVTRKKLAPAVAKSAFSTITFTTSANTAEFQRVQNVAYSVGQLRKKGDLNGFIYGK
ncbi:aliphatic sulfonate ABC transporter substrate-binding protein [bacterium]|nr:MAG: aliphatic sulfonate ABC transporter substrate-binding protein [bacterium]